MPAFFWIVIRPHMVARLFALSLVVVVATACGASKSVTKSPTGKVARCTLLLTNDSEANFDGERVKVGPQIAYTGTIDRVAATKKRLVAEGRGVLLISAGDILQGRYIQRTDGNRVKAATDIWHTYQKAGYDLAVLGNHEFDGGPAVVRDSIKGLTSLKLVVSNLDEGKGTALDNSGQKLFVHTTIRNCGGMKLGFFGLLTASTKRISDFGDTRFSNPEDPHYPAARAAVAKLRKTGVDAVVGITHLGLGSDIATAKHVDGIDVLLGGHSHILLRREKKVNGTVIVQGGARFAHLGHVELYGKPGGGYNGDRTYWYVHKIDENMPADPAITAHVNALRGNYPPEVVIGQRRRAWSLRGRARKVYGGLVARAVTRWLGERKIDVGGGLLNAGGIRTAKTYPKGPVTNLEIEGIHPFRNRIVVARMKGKWMRHLAEHACTKGHRGRGLRVVLYGIDIACDRSQDAIKYTWKGGAQVGIKRPGSRVVTLRIGGKDVVDTADYAIATNDYLARGGSGYWAFTQVQRTCPDGSDFTKTLCKTGPALADIVKDAVRRDRLED